MENRRENAIQELLRGRDFTCQLKLLLSTLSTTTDSKPSLSALSSATAANRNGGSAEDLVGKILSTFTHTISLLNTSTAANVVDSSSSGGVSLDGPRKSKSSSGDSSSKASTSTDRPGCYKKRKMSASHSWVKESPTLVDDGHAWRKYGQKTILNSEFPRQYYRCTHKFEQKCQASKQVQMVQDRPSPLYRTTYFGHHTCHNHFIITLHGSSQEHFLIDPVDDSDSGHLVSFSQKSSSTTAAPFLESLSGSSGAAVKQQQQQEVSLSGVASCGGGQTLNQAAAAVSSHGDDDYDMLSSYVDGNYHGDQQFSGTPTSVCTAADHDEDDNGVDRSFLQTLIMDSVDDLQRLLS